MRAARERRSSESENLESLAYRISHEGEPHFRRRAEILRRHPEIRSLYGFDRVPIAKTVFMVSAQLAVAAGLQAAAEADHWIGSFWTMLAAAVVFGAFCCHYAGVIIHESSHNLCARSAVANRLLALVANIPVVVPAAMSFRRYHMGHHIYMGIEGKDNDLPMRWEARWVGNSAWRKLVWLFFYPFFATLGRGFIRKPDRWEVLNAATQLAAMTGVVLLLGGTALGYLALATFFGYGLHPVAGNFIHEHYLWSPEQETYSYYGPINKVALNMGYHNEHHDFMNVPGSRLPVLHQIAREHYAALASHRSWSLVMWRFVTKPCFSHFSRFVRTQETYEQVRRGLGHLGHRGSGACAGAAAARPRTGAQVQEPLS